MLATQANEAFVDTLQGLLYLGEYLQDVELRIIPTQYNVDVLDHIMMFIVSHYPFIRLISIMNLEPKGWARNQFNDLYVPVKTQNDSLRKAVDIGLTYGLTVQLFNYPLCLLSDDLKAFACKSISDWKNYYPSACEQCSLKTHCGGFFTSATGSFIETIEVQS